MRDEKAKLLGYKNYAELSLEFKMADSPDQIKSLFDSISKKAKPKASDSVSVHYKGWLNDGTIFDSSYQRGKQISFPLNGVIPGWTEGLQLVGKGGMIELEIPSELGYGPRRAGKIPPNSTLRFAVELFEIE